MSRHAYARVRQDPAAAVALARDGDTVLPIGAAEAPALLHAPSERRHGRAGVTVFALLPLTNAGYVDPGTGDRAARRC